MRVALRFVLVALRFVLVALRFLLVALRFVQNFRHDCLPPVRLCRFCAPFLCGSFVRPYFALVARALAPLHHDVSGSSATESSQHPRGMTSKSGAKCGDSLTA